MYSKIFQKAFIKRDITHFETSNKILKTIQKFHSKKIAAKNRIKQNDFLR